MKREKLLKNMMTPRKWFDLAGNDDKAEIYIYEQIGASFWDEGLTPKSFMEQVKAIKAPSIDLHINSPGGNVYDGFAIYNFLKTLDKEIIGIVDSMAASVASVILMAADKRIMAETSTCMIHDPWGLVMGNASVFRKEADELDRIQGQIADVYVARTGLPREKINDLMKSETFMTGRESLDFGFADEVTENKKLAACAFDLDIFDNLPAHIKSIANATRKRSLEDALRDAGYSRHDAVKIASGPRSESGDDVELAAMLRANINTLKLK